MEGHADSGRRRVPVVVITGAPGVGKTSLLNRLIAELPGAIPGAEPAVITHRFAREFGLDLSPVREDPSTPTLRGEMFDFGSGCVCCSPSGELVQHLLAIKREASSLGDEASRPWPPPTHVLIETTGLADPSFFVRLVTTHPDVCDSFQLTALVTIVGGDVADVAGRADPASRRFCQQMLAADIVAVAGSASAAQAALRDVIPEIDTPPTVPVHELTWARLSGLSCARSHAVCVDESLGVGMCDARPVALGGHDRSFETCCVVEEGPLQAARLESFAESAVRASCSPPGTLLRIKGVVTVATGVDHTIPAKRLHLEWEPRMGARMSMHELPESAGVDPALGPVRSLGHAMVAGLDVPLGTCKVFFCGTHLRVNDLRSAMWSAMVPEGCDLAADIELDFPAAWRRAQAESRREPPASSERPAGPEEVSDRCAVRLENWLGPGQDAIVFWVDGAFAACSDVGVGAGAGATWSLLGARITSETAPGGSGYVLWSQEGEIGFDLATGQGLKRCEAADAAPASESTSTSRLESAGMRLVTPIDFHIIGGSIYVSKTARAAPPGGDGDTRRHASPEAAFES